MKPSKLRVAMLVLANVLGLLAFFWPFVLPSKVQQGANSTLILIALLACIGTLLFVELGRGGMGPKAVALVGVLGAAMVALRLPGYVLGFSAMFIVVLVGGNSFGPGFGFLLGSVGMFASGLFVGGIGPWLPFQMVAAGWMGMGAGVLPNGSWPKLSWRARLAALAVYGFVWGYVFGFVMSLWDWPFIMRSSSSAISFVPGAGVAENLRNYYGYYVATSLTWDTFRAVGDVILVLALGRPLLGTLDRAARRMRLDIVPAIERPRVG